MRRTEQESVRMASLVDDLLLARLDEGRPPTVTRRPRVASAAADARRRPTALTAWWPKGSWSTATRTVCGRCWATSSATLVHTPAAPRCRCVHTDGRAVSRSTTTVGMPEDVVAA
jgi:hypothetical protein